MPSYDRRRSSRCVNTLYTGNYPNYTTKTTSDSQIMQPYNVFTKSTKIDNPLWAERKKKPWLFVAPSNYSHSSHIETHWQGNLTLVNVGSFRIITGNISGGVSGVIGLTTLPSHDANLRSRAITKALLKLKNQKMDLSVTYLEREQTANLLYDTAVSMKKAYRDVRKGKLKRAAERFRNTKFKGPKAIVPPAKSREEIVKRYNEIQYGWKPAMNDVLAASKALAARDSTDDMWCNYHVSVRGGAKSEKVDSLLDTAGNCDKRSYRFTKQRAHCRLFYRPPTNDLLVAGQQLGLTNPFSTAYEVIPLSFILDFVLPIGGYLNVLDAALPYSFIGGWITEVTEINVVGVLTGKGNVTAEGYSKCYKHQSDRQSLSMSPFPDFPDMRAAGLTQTSNAMAIFASISAGKA